MKLSAKLLCVLAVSSVLSGCATSGPKFVELEPSISNISPDMGRIYVYRPSALGAAIRPNVKLNGEVVGQAISYGFFYLDRSPGNYEIMTSTEVDRKLTLTLGAGETRFVRLNVSMGFFVAHVYPELIDNKIAQEEIKDTRYIGKK